MPRDILFIPMNQQNKGNCYVSSIFGQMTSENEAVLDSRRGTVLYIEIILLNQCLSNTMTV